ncbi:CdiA C-terminal domain-containing protein [Actinoplanes subglobosus]|uniref:tRNA nuclease CdiA C-terminal domain-containing protein n=1 Tax=Actinoplanes subglobosus TaxID=1547892 RepID=A0ABV8IZD3_9ACTN
MIADAGYRIHQNPTPLEVANSRSRTGDIGSATRKPDYLIEGRVFDCYSPTKANKAVRGIWDEAEDKVNKGQTQRVVVNLEDWRGDLDALQRQFDNWPIPGLKELKVVTQRGEIIQMNLPEENYRG